jgi:hypothetical protein
LFPDLDTGRDSAFVAIGFMIFQKRRGSDGDNSSMSENACIDAALAPAGVLSRIFLRILSAPAGSFLPAH